MVRRRVVQTFLAAFAVVAALVAPADPGRLAGADPLALCDGYSFVAEAGGFARSLPSGGYVLCNPLTGALTQTHGGDIADDVAGAGAHQALPTGESMVDCPAHNYGPQVVFLYGHVAGTPWRYSEVMPQLRSIIRRMNYKIGSAAAASGGAAPVIRTPCMLENGSWVPWVGGFTNNPGSSSGAPAHSFQDIKESLLESYPEYGNDGSPIKYVVFYDSNLPPYAGQGEGYFNSYNRWDNPNATYSTMAYVVSSYWATHVTMHEMFHAFGAVQFTAPHSNWIAHCNDGGDVMCYDQQGQPGAYPGPYDDYRCSYTEEAGYVPLDCKYDTYFDAQTPPGSYLGDNWNTGAPVNPFLKFPYAMNFSSSASPSSHTITAGQSATSTITLSSSGNFSGSLSLSTSGTPAGSTTTLSSSDTYLSSNGTASFNVTLRPASTQQSSYTVTVTACGPIGCRSVNITVVPRYFTVAVQPSTITAGPGASGTATVTVTSRNGYAGPANLSASGVPAGNTVTFDSSSLNVPANGSASTTLRVTNGPLQLSDYSFTVTACASPCASRTVRVDTGLPV